MAGRLVKYNGSSTDVVIPDGVKIIATQVFKNMTALHSVVMSDTVEEVELAAFYGCSSLSSIQFSNNLKIIGDAAFKYCSSLTQLNIPNKVTTINVSAFYDCEKLIKINIPNSVKYIKSKAFSGCKSLVEINFPTSNIDIDASVFSNCDSLVEVTIPETVRFVKKAALVPDVNEWYGGVFDDCKSLKIINCPSKYEQAIRESTPQAFVNGEVSKNIIDGKSPAICPKCGGKLKGLFSKHCNSCGATYKT